MVRSSDRYLRNQRKGENSYELTQLEKQILVALNIELGKVEELGGMVIDELKQHATGPTFPTDKIHAAIETVKSNMFSKDAKKLATGKFG